MRFTEETQRTQRLILFSFPLRERRAERHSLQIYLIALCRRAFSLAVLLDGKRKT